MKKAFVNFLKSCQYHLVENYRYLKDGGFGAFHCAYDMHILGWFEILGCLQIQRYFYSVYDYEEKQISQQKLLASKKEIGEPGNSFTP